MVASGYAYELGIRSIPPAADVKRREAFFETDSLRERGASQFRRRQDFQSSLPWAHRLHRLERIGELIITLPRIEEGDELVLGLAREMCMQSAASAADFLPHKITLPSLRRAAANCEGCPLYRNATQTVFGRGKPGAKLLIIGEQPGDQEDLVSEPFVGPAGRLLREILEEARILDEEVYVTNAVKHFKWTPKGKRRLHAKPSAREMKACHPWLEAELEVIDPALVVCLGATAAQSIFGSAFRLTQNLGEIKETPAGQAVLATYHPSAILRAPDEGRAQLRAQLLADMRRAARFIM